MSDEAARERIRTCLDETLFVDAGAGTGKTKALVDRIVSLVESGVQMRGIAAITFTDAAASELRDRIRAALEAAARAGTVDPSAADQVDEAAVSTLHAFAQRILTEHPLEAGVPPSVEVSDDIESSLAFDERFAAFRDRLLEDPAYERVLIRGLATGLDLQYIADLGEIFNQHWDRLRDAVLPTPPLRAVDAAPIVAHLRAALGYRSSCCADDDKLAVHLDGLVDLPDELEAAGDEVVVLQMLTREKGLPCRGGQAGNWDGLKQEVVSALDRAEEARATLVDGVQSEVLQHLAAAVADFTLQAADDRRRSGRLEFHDLLVMARDLLDRDRSVRVALRERYSHLLIDEFQDTDPIQLELAVRIAGDPDAPVLERAEASVEPGRLFFVGDPKQSIYRFRRADIELFLHVRDNLVKAPELLTRNFRSVPGVIDWVNGVFAELIGEGDGHAQAGYVELEAARQPIAPDRPVVLLGDEHPKGENIGAVRRAEAAEVAATVRRMKAEKWPVGDAAGGRRELEYRDVAVLMPTRTALAELERAFDDEGVPYRVVSASLVWATQEVRDLLSVLQAIDDPTDGIALVAALRSPALACGDDDLLAWRQAGGRWDVRAPVPESLGEDHSVALGMATLRELQRGRWWASVSELVERVLRELRFFELAFAHARPRDRWRRLRWVLEQARAFEAQSLGAAGGLGGLGAGGPAGLRAFLAWARIQADERARVKESPLPEADDDAVQISTVHGAKGLEYPAVVLTGLNRAPGGQTQAATVLWDGKRPEIALWRGFATPGFAELRALEKEMDRHEKLRLLYVAATRAQDHLVVSLHRKHRDPGSHAALLAPLCDDRPELWRRLDSRPVLELQSPPGPGPSLDGSADPGADRREWEAERQRLIASSSVAPVRAATAVAELAKEASVLEGEWVVAGEGDGREPWRRGRAGTSVGRAVHATLQTVDLVSGEGLDDIAAAQAAAEGVLALTGEVERLARAALDTPSVQEAVAGRYWRELYVGAPVDGSVVEGYVDLLFEAADGSLVVVDYKTDAVSSDTEIDGALARYRLQGAAYAVALEESLGRAVAECRFVFLAASGEARERRVDDLDAAKNEVRRLVAPGIPAAQ